MYNPILDGDVYHNDDVKPVGEALIRVNQVEIDYESAASRNLRDIRANIARSRKREEDLRKLAIAILPQVC